MPDPLLDDLKSWFRLQVNDSLGSMLPKWNSGDSVHDEVDGWFSITIHGPDGLSCSVGWHRDDGQDESLVDKRVVHAVEMVKDAWSMELFDA